MSVEPEMNTEQSPLVELRHYRLRDVEAREYFDRRSRAVTFPLFVKYGFRIERFWVDEQSPLDIYYLVGWDSVEQKERMWAQFQADPLWGDMVNAPDYVVPVAEATSVMLSSAVDYSQMTAT